MNPLFYKKKCCCDGTSDPPSGTPCEDFGYPNYPWSSEEGAACSCLQQRTWSPVVTFGPPKVAGFNVNDDNLCFDPSADCYDSDAGTDRECFPLSDTYRIPVSTDENGDPCRCRQEYSSGGAFGMSNIVINRGLNNGCADCITNTKALFATGGSSGTVTLDGVQYPIRLSYVFGNCYSDDRLFKPSFPLSHCGGGQQDLCETTQWCPETIAVTSTGSTASFSGTVQPCDRWESFDTCYLMEKEKFWGVVSGYGPVPVTVGAETSEGCCSDGYVSCPFVILMEGTPNFTSFPLYNQSNGSAIDYQAVAGWVPVFGNCKSHCTNFNCDCNQEDAYPASALPNSANCSSVSIPVACSDWTQVDC